MPGAPDLGPHGLRHTRRDAPARRRCRPAQRPGGARPRQPVDDADLHPRLGRTAAADLPASAPARLTLSRRAARAAAPPGRGGAAATADRGSPARAAHPSAGTSPGSRRAGRAAGRPVAGAGPMAPAAHQRADRFVLGPDAVRMQHHHDAAAGDRPGEADDPVAGRPDELHRRRPRDRRRGGPVRTGSRGGRTAAAHRTRGRARRTSRRTGAIGGSRRACRRRRAPRHHDRAAAPAAGTARTTTTVADPTSAAACRSADPPHRALWTSGRPVVHRRRPAAHRGVGRPGARGIGRSSDAAPGATADRRTHDVDPRGDQR